MILMTKKFLKFHAKIDTISKQKYPKGLKPTKELPVTKTKILNQLVKMVCEKEGGKKKLDAPQARETIKVIAMLELQSQNFCDLFNDYRCELLKGTPKKAKKKK